MEANPISQLCFTVLALGSVLQMMALAAPCPTPVGMPPQGEGWVALFDGAPDGLPPSDWIEVGGNFADPLPTWSVQDDVLIREDGGGSNHLFYVGSEAPWTDLELICEFRTEIGTNSGVLFRVDNCQSDGSGCSIEGTNGLEAQINNTSTGALPKKTGALFPDGDDLLVSPVQDNEWTHMRIIVEGTSATIEINGSVTATDTLKAIYPSSGTIALQSEGLGSGDYDRIEFRNIYIRDLPVSSCDGWDQGSPSNDPEPMAGNSSSDESLKSELTTLGHYHFDSDLQNSAKDLYHLRAYGSAALASTELGWMAQPLGQALQFTGKDDYLIGVYLDSEVQPTSESFTVEALLYVSRVKDQGESSLSLLDFGTISFGQSTWETEPTLSFNDTSLFPTSAVKPHWNLDQWMHFRIVYDPTATGSELKLYINDSLVGEGAASISAAAISNWTLRLGHFEGYVDELRVSKGALDSGGTIPLAKTAWLERFFTSADLGNDTLETALWGDNADADGDGFSTLAEYCLGLNPTVPDGLEAFQADTTTHPIVMDYIEPKQAIEMDLNVLGSTTIGSWLPEGATLTTITDGLLFKHMRATLTQDYSAATRAFFSLGIAPASP